MSANPNAPSPETLAQQRQLPLMRALINFDLRDPEPQVLGCDPVDLTDIPTEPVKTMIRPEAIVSICAHQGEGQDVYDLLYADPRLVNMVKDYAEQYFQEGVMSFEVNALTPREIANVRRYIALENALGSRP